MILFLVLLLALWFMIGVMAYYWFIMVCCWFDLGNAFGEPFREPLPTNMLAGHVG